MPAGSLLMLLDDIASVMDDVAVLTKVAAKKTAGVLGDDLALNAQQVSGFEARRELPVVWAVAKGSAINKVVLVPSALLISAVAPVLVTPFLMVGGAYLCFEGVEKVLHSLLHRKEPVDSEAARVPVDAATFERERIRGAVRTDFILSAEIIVISLGTVQGQPLAQQFGVLSAISVIMTVGVYGLVAGIVKLDDAGLSLARSSQRGLRALGWLLLRGSPVLMRFLGIVGTAAMFLVGGGILAHGLPAIHHWVADLRVSAGGMGFLVEPLVGAVLGIAAGLVIVGLLAAVRRIAVRFRRPGNGGS